MQETERSENNDRTSQAVNEAKFAKILLLRAHVIVFTPVAPQTITESVWRSPPTKTHHQYMFDASLVTNSITPNYVTSKIIVL